MPVVTSTPEYAPDKTEFHNKEYKMAITTARADELLALEA